MTVSQPSRSGQPRAVTPSGDRAPAAPGCERAYDSFVVRLWHPQGDGRLLRAEVEHVQTGQVARAAEVELAWILARLRACLNAAAVDPGSPSGCSAEDT